MSELLSCKNVEKSIGNRVLFEDLTFNILERERIGLIGPNGAGKSTLLKTIGGVLEQDAGEVTTRKGVKLVYLPQVETFDESMTILEAAMEAAKDDIEDDFIKQSNASIALSRIGFEDLDEKVKNLSGGWLKRLSIARQIARDPDVLLLDEPTNHLDVEGIEWLEDYLKKAKFAYMIITHDRTFLERATNRIIELSDIFDGGILSFNCAYDEFMRRRTEFLEAERARFESLSNKNRREQEWVKSGVRARGTKQKARLQEASDLQQTVHKLKKQTAEPSKILVDFETTDRKTKRLIVAHSISKAFGDKKICTDFDLTLTAGVRIGLLGNNGVGKTTLMKMLMGAEKPDTGGVTITNGIKVLHFDQKRQLLDENATLKEALSLSGSDTVIYRGKETHISSWARKLKFRSDQLDTPISSLSGGERARIIMGRLMLQTADVLLLDEPTNDLDIPSIEVLEESLTTFPGAIILVTHDRAMLDRVSSILLALDGQGNITPYSSYEQWKKGNSGDEVSTSEETKPVEEKSSKESAKKKLTKLSYKDQRDWDSIEERILEAETELEDMQSNPVSHDDTDAFMTYCEELGVVQEKVDNLYARWEELQLMMVEIEKNKA